MNSTVVDISNTTSTGKFVEAIEDAILGLILKSRWIQMVMSSLEGTMAVKLFFSPLRQLPVRREVGILQAVKVTRSR